MSTLETSQLPTVSLLLDKALQEAELINDTNDLLWILCRIAGLQAKAGDFVGAKATLQKGVQSAKKIEYKHTREAVS